jgi:asparagine synthase (glutamine-hydrolysing)
MLVGFISQLPLGPHELGRSLDALENIVVTSENHKAHRVIFGPHVAGTAFAPSWRTTPATYQTQSGHIAWLDGEFFNRSELVKAHRWTANTDVEFLAHAVTGGNERFSALDGLFSGVVFDGYRNELHSVTDRYGLRPLYWTRQGTRIAWASQTKAFLSLPDFSPTIDPISREVFLATGQLPSDRTWLKGIEPIPPRTRITFRLSDGGFTRQHYWSWDDIAPLVGSQDIRELARELGSRFRRAVEQRSSAQTGLILSGGLDSRAILAAMPHSPHTFTFGVPNSSDVLLAAKAASVKKAGHTVLPLTRENWLAPRIPGIWWTDGALDLIHMHGIEHLNRQKEAFDICLNGAGGDGLAGAGHLFHPHELIPYLQNRLNLDTENHPSICNQIEAAFKKVGTAHAFYIDWRMRGFTIQGPRLSLFHGLEYRLPFLDNQVQEFLYALPLKIKTGNRLYRQMLLQTFPEYFKTIPWQSTGFPLSWPPWIIKGLRGFARLRNRSRHTPFANYADWLRTSPGKTVCERLLQDPHAHYHAYANARQISELWQRHLKGENHTNILGRHLTFELYLRQLFDARYRTHEETTELLTSQ